MSPRAPFTLQLPDSRTLEIVIVELEDGTIVARTAAELKPAAASTMEPA